MTARVLKQDPNTWKVNKKAIKFITAKRDTRILNEIFQFNKNGNAVLQQKKTWA